MAFSGSVVDLNLCSPCYGSGRNIRGVDSLGKKGRLWQGQTATAEAPPSASLIYDIPNLDSGPALVHHRDMEKETSICQWYMEGNRAHNWTSKFTSTSLDSSPDRQWLVAMDELQSANFIRETRRRNA